MATEENTNEISEDPFWRSVARRYWYFLVIFVVLCVGAVIGFIFVFNWYVVTSPIGGFGAWTFDQFSMATAILWCLWLVLWTLLFVALPTLAVAAIFIAIFWFVVISPELKAEIKTRSKRPRPGKRDSGSGGFSFLLFIGVCIFVFIDGNWFTPFGSLSIGYFATVWIIVFMWAFVIFGFAALIFGIYWLGRRNGSSESMASLEEVPDKGA